MRFEPMDAKAKDSGLGISSNLEPVEPRVPVTTRINGVARTLHVRPDESALTLLRDRVGITSAKLGCGQGVCGACTVKLDGTPVVSCLLPATSLEARTVETVDALGPALHPVQRAFMAQDALQCGFCTPGFIVEASSFYDRWRAAHGTAAPTREQIAQALAGHLCRCGAYEGIYLAVRDACTGKFDHHDPIPARHDALAKVTGRAKYTVDVHYEGQLEARILRSPHAHARVKHLDFARAAAMPGVSGVVEMLTAGRLIRYAGQEILAIAAIDVHTAEAALRLVEIEYEVLPAAVGIDAARAPGAAVVYPSMWSRFSAPSAAEGPVVPAFWSQNFRGPFFLFTVCSRRARRIIGEARRGDGCKMAEGVWRTQVQCHSALEPHACVARWESPERLTVHVGTQAVTRMASDIAQRWDLERDNVQVLAEYVGGAFGAKTDLGPEVRAAVDLARLTGAAVRVALDRREELTVGGSRPGQELHFAVAATREGGLGAMSLKAYSDSGVAIGNVSSAMIRLMYPGAPKSLFEWDVTTHASQGKPFRGPGGPPAFWAMEQAIDQVAIERNEDPIELRRRWDTSPLRAKLYDWASALPVWRERKEAGAEKGRFRRGVGLAASGWFYFNQPATQVQVDSSKHGFSAACGTQDMGNGSRTAIANAVAGVFGVEPHTIHVEVGDSRLLTGPMSAGSRTTASVVPASEDGANQICQRLVDYAEGTLRLKHARAAHGGIEYDGGFMPWSEVLAAAPAMSAVGRRLPDQGGYLLPFTVEDMAVGKTFSGGVQITEVIVDTRLGHVRVTRTWGGYACGKIIAPMLARSQAEGGMIQGLSYALYEERRLEPRQGFNLTANFDDYRIAGIGDIPEIHVHFMEEGFEHVTGGTVGLGEIVTLAPAASLGNAIKNATGWRPHELPIRPDRVLAGLGS